MFTKSGSTLLLKLLAQAPRVRTFCPSCGLRPSTLGPINSETRLDAASAENRIGPRYSSSTKGALHNSWMLATKLCARLKNSDAEGSSFGVGPVHDQERSSVIPSLACACAASSIW